MDGVDSDLVVSHRLARIRRFLTRVSTSVEQHRAPSERRTKTVVWVGEASLLPRPNEHGRRALYQTLVAGRGVLEPLETMESYLMSLIQGRCPNSGPCRLRPERYRGDTTRMG